jgi:cytochrome P450
LGTERGNRLDNSAARAVGVWLLTRYDDCHAALRDPRLGKDYARQMERNVGPDWRRHPSLTVREHSMLNVDGPEHLRLRRLVVKAFTRRTIDALRPSIEQTVTGSPIRSPRPAAATCSRPSPSRCRSP